MQERLDRGQRLYSGEEIYELRDSGEEGVNQIHALLGLSTLVTNVNVPNKGQISNLPYGTIVETNAAFRDGMFQPLFAGEVPESIYPLVSRAARENEDIVEAGFSEDLKFCCEKFKKLNMIKTLTEEQKETLFWEMIEGTKAYLPNFK